VGGGLSEQGVRNRRAWRDGGTVVAALGAGLLLAGLRLASLETRVIVFDESGAVVALLSRPWAGLGTLLFAIGAVAAIAGVAVAL